MSNKDNETITVSKTSIWQGATAIFAILFVASLFTGGFGIGGTGAVVVEKNEPTQPAPTVPTAPTAPTAGPKVSFDLDNDAVLGEKDAKITIVEFSDFQCPFCQRAADGAVADFKNSDLYKNGDANLVFKHLPLRSIHPQAQKAAEASECAADQGKFWEYHDLIFANQQSLSVDNLKAHAGTLGLDQGKFDSCLDGGDKEAKVNADMQAAAAAGGRGTPYFVVVNNENGKTQAVSGAVPYTQFEAAFAAVQ